MSEWGKRLIACAAACACMFGLARWVFPLKAQAVWDAQKSTQEALRATELAQPIRRLEVELRYGKTLENYYSMAETLEELRRSSPYIDGVYVIGADNALLYQAGLPLRQQPPVALPPDTDAYYSSVPLDGETLLFMDILGVDGSRAGRMAALLNDSMMNAAAEEERAESHWQSRAIAAEGMLLALALLMAARRGKFLWLTAALVISVSALGAFAADVTIEAAKLHAKAETSTAQGVQKIAQVLQEQIGQVADKGVSPEDMYDVHGWLRSVRDKLPFVRSLEFTAEGRVRAAPDDQYAGQVTIGFLMDMGRWFLAAAGCCAALCMVAFAVDQALAKRAAARGISTTGTTRDIAASDTAAHDTATRDIATRRGSA